MTHKIREIMTPYDVILLDAYGVLVDAKDALPGAKVFIEDLNRSQKPYFILTNGAARYPSTTAEAYRQKGLNIPNDRVITSGSLIAEYLKENQPQLKRAVVLGTEQSKRMVADGGVEVVSLGKDFDLLVIADQTDVSLKIMDDLISILYQRFDQGRPPHLLLPNPDILYPTGSETFGFTAGGLALMIEEALKLRYPNNNKTTFVRLGKPHAPIFRAAQRLSGGKKMLMIGDQLHTDIKGASDNGIDSVLVGTGISRFEELKDYLGPKPTYLVDDLW